VILLYLPVAIFLATVLWAGVAARDNGRSSSRLSVIGGSVGIASAVVTAYAIHDRSQKFADAATNTQTNNIAVALLLAHAALFFLLLLRRA
jgi:hypothetical protein